jgi:2-polyprenyl-3-methyl-5-hydroxy-6-metoxy-1,4-benzoquinol methylase
MPSMPRADPARIVDTLIAYWRSDALKAAIDLDLFTALGGRRRTAAQLAAQCDAEGPGLRTLCDYLASLGLLRVRRGRYSSAPDARRFLDAASPDALVAIPRFFNADPLASAFSHLARTVRHGAPPIAASRRERMWRTFATAALPLRRWFAGPAADALLKMRLVRGRILDVGAGASPLGIELLRRTEDTSLVVQDRPSIVRVALRHARDSGVRDRVSALAGDARTVAWPGPFDLILMVNVLDYLDEDVAARILKKARAALAPAGTLAVCSPLLDESRTGPADAVAHALMLVALGAAGRAATVGETTRRLRRAGFSTVAAKRSASLVLGRRQR